MDSKTALRGPNASAGPFARSTTAIARLRVRSTQPVSLTSSGGQYGPRCNQNTETHPWTSQTGPYHEYPRHPDHRQVHAQEWCPKIAELPVLGHHAPHDYEYLSPYRQSGDQECCSRVARSAGAQSPHVCVLSPAVLLGRGINIDSNSNSRLNSLASPLSRPAVRVEAFGAGSC